VNSATLPCPNCKTDLRTDLFNGGAFQQCPQCDRSVLCEIFPAFLRNPIQGASAEPVVAQSESSCFFHPQKKAVIACGRCGRFVCALCDLELAGQHVCPTCLHLDRESAEISPLQNHRVLYDNVAVGLAILPVLFWPATIFTAPAAIFVALYYWKRPGSIIPRTKVRAILAIVLALLQIVGWCVIGVMMWHGKA
jgi:hypothetical protein